jgi:hypothetical protein
MSGKKQCIELGYTDASEAGDNIFCESKTHFRTLEMAKKEQQIINKQLGKK